MELIVQIVFLPASYLNLLFEKEKLSLFQIIVSILLQASLLVVFLG